VSIIPVAAFWYLNSSKQTSLRDAASSALCVGLVSMLVTAGEVLRAE
jgi:hypothetical protein